MAELSERLRAAIAELVKQCADFGVIYGDDNEPPEEPNEIEWMTYFANTTLTPAIEAEIRDTLLWCRRQLVGGKSPSEEEQLDATDHKNALYAIDRRLKSGAPTSSLKSANTSKGE